MNVLDIVFLAVIGVSALLSLRVGLVREVFALGALLIGLLAAIVLGRAYGARVPNLLGSPVATQLVFFVVCFLLGYLLVSLLGAVVSRMLKAIHLSWLDHLLGMVFGVLRGALLAFLVLALLTFILPENHRLLLGSRAYRLSLGPMQVFAGLLPERPREVLEARCRRDLARLRHQGEATPAEQGEGALKKLGIPL